MRQVNQDQDKLFMQKCAENIEIFKFFQFAFANHVHA